jgi:hypothetical protein
MEWTNARPSIGDIPMTGAERQARYRDRCAGHSQPPACRSPQPNPAME